ncbi:Beta-barrel assembly machine subunit BamB [Fontimonas thermophila]|uniref:Outer membrane protein assembly factor BamB n=1 Tax=Fontimonas thermophila TaxID=1076937 RepID=A0A1I2JL11_9GAMM|nr:Beta-barrel assembly machine subunit BamB [Fontimonas thermophila]
MLVRVLLVAALVGSLGACSKDGKVREPAELQDIVNPQLRLSTVWTARAGEGSGKYRASLDVTVAEDAVYAAEVGGRVYAFDPNTGARLWVTDTDARVISGPSVSGNAVLVGTMEGEVIALKRADGAPYWRSTISSEALATPVGDGNLVIARAGDGRVHALSAVSGSALWMFERTVPSLTLRGLGKPVIDGNRVFVGMDNGRVAALRMADGQPIWEQAVAAPSGRNELERLTDIDGALLLDGGELYVASYGGEVACLDGDTGQVLWRRAVKSYTGPTRIGDIIVVSDESGVVWGLDATTGAAAWKNEDLKYRRLSPPAAFAERIVVGDYEGYLHWLDPKDGRLVARARAGRDPIQAVPVADGALLYVLDTAGRLAAIRAD